MSRDPHLRLEDIIEACERLQSHHENLELADFDRDLKTQDAVIRVFEIIARPFAVQISSIQHPKFNIQNLLSAPPLRPQLAPA